MTPVNKTVKSKQVDINKWDKMSNSENKCPRTKCLDVGLKNPEVFS